MQGNTMNRVFILRYVYADRVELRYFVGDEEGYSVMESLAYRFKDHELGKLVDLIHNFYKNQEDYLAKAPSNCRSITAYPQKLHADYNVE